MRVVCREGEHRVPEEETFQANRFGGGNYRKAGRHYRSRICVACAEELLAEAPSHAGASVRRWSVATLRAALERYRKMEVSR